MEKIFPYGILKVVKLQGTDGGTSLDVRPSAGRQWRLLDCWGYHDDTSVRNLTWSYYDGTNTITKKPTGTLAANVLLSINGVASSATSVGYNSPEVVLTNSVYAKFGADAMAAGHFLYVNALVLEITE